MISILITHYNRPLELLKCLEAIKKSNLDDYEIVVSDDKSEDENIKKIQKYDIDKLVLSTKNQGLAANINKGIKACEGEYIIYCQEDFLIQQKLKNVLPEFLKILDKNQVDMIRFTSYFKFNKLIKLSDDISLIPKFSFYNFSQNYYQYSDHPFLVKKKFYNSFGRYLENTSGDYGETEYAIRIFKSKAKIAITTEKYVLSILGSESVIDRKKRKTDFKLKKSWIKFGRSIRLYFEWIFYNKNKRGLITYKNLRTKVN